MEKQKLTIDGIEYELSYDFNRICDCEAQAGCNLIDALSDFVGQFIEGSNRKPSAQQFRGLLLGALQRDGKWLTLAEVGALMRIDTLAHLRGKLLAAYNASMPDEPKAPAAAPPEPPKE
jgi:hypothetical protein